MGVKTQLYPMKVVPDDIFLEALPQTQRTAQPPSERVLIVFQ